MKVLFFGRWKCQHASHSLTIFHRITPCMWEKRKKKKKTRCDYVLQHVWTNRSLALRSHSDSAVTYESQDFFRELNWRTHKVNDVFRSRRGDSHTHRRTNTHPQCTHRAQIKLWQWASEHRLSWQSREPPTAEQSHKKKTTARLTGGIGEKSKMFVAFSPSGSYLRLQMWFIPFPLIPLPLSFTFSPPFASPPRTLTAPPFASPPADYQAPLSFPLTLLFPTFSSRFPALSLSLFPRLLLPPSLSLWQFDESRQETRRRRELGHIRWCRFRALIWFFSCEQRLTSSVWKCRIVTEWGIYLSINSTRCLKRKIKMFAKTWAD